MAGGLPAPVAPFTAAPQQPPRARSDNVVPTSGVPAGDASPTYGDQDDSPAVPTAAAAARPATARVAAAGSRLTGNSTHAATCRESTQEVIEIEKIVPVYDYQVQERIVEVPQVEMIHTEVEVERVQEVVKRVSKKEIIQVPTDVIKYVTKVVTKIVEKVVEVPGDVIQVPKPYTVENRVIIPRYINQETPVMVNQLVQPVIRESDTESITVVVRQYEPFLVPVDVFIPKPVSRPLVPVEVRNAHQAVDVPPSQFNALVKAVNAGATDQDVDGLLVKHLDGSIPMLSMGTPVPPQGNDWRETHDPTSTRLRVQTTPGQSFVCPNLSKQTIMPAPA